MNRWVYSNRESECTSGESFVGKRKKFVFNASIDFKPVYRFEYRGDITEFESLNYSTSKRVLNLLKTIYLRFWQIVVVRVTVVKFRVNNRCGNGTRITSKLWRLIWPMTYDPLTNWPISSSAMQSLRPNRWVQYRYMFSNFWFHVSFCYLYVWLVALNV